jgi:hypothetical protein
MRAALFVLLPLPDPDTTRWCGNRKRVMLNFSSIRRRLLSIAPKETQFARRGFPVRDLAVQQHLESAGGAFVEGYNAAVGNPRTYDLLVQLNKVESVYSGFAFEGAAMGLALLDHLTPWNRRRFYALLVTHYGNSHLYMLHVGIGWAIARLPWARRNFERAIRRYDPLYRALALDGYGFHQGFFHTEQFVDREALPSRLSPSAQRIFDQGLGRSLWFSQGADADRLAAVISRFPTPRQPDLWGGIGLAATYAGGVERIVLERLLDRSGPCAAHLAQAATFAAKARQRAGNPTSQTEMACDVFCRLSADAAAAVSDRCLEGLESGVAPPNGEPAYLVWRRRIREQFAPAGQETLNPFLLGSQRL